jgi:hypothetical protein
MLSNLILLEKDREAIHHQAVMTTDLRASSLAISGAASR